MFSVMQEYIQVSEVFVIEKATKTFSFVAFFLTAWLFWDFSLYVRRYTKCQTEQ